jgi:hypothetical protein
MDIADRAGKSWLKIFDQWTTVAYFYEANL